MGSICHIPGAPQQATDLPVLQLRCEDVGGLGRGRSYDRDGGGVAMLQLNLRK